jgi:hypothetical protein
MSSKPSLYPKKIRMKIAGKTYVATFDVEDECVQVTHKGRRSIWTEMGGSRPEDVAKMLLRELLGMLVATLYFAALAEHAGAVWASATEMHAPQAISPSAESLLPTADIRMNAMDARRDFNSPR